jgi:putative hydrolase of the HAD superfamily
MRAGPHLKAIAFDLGHTLMDERRDQHVPIRARPVHLMPGVADVLPRLTLPLAVWANTRMAREADVRGWLDRAGLGAFFRWVITSVDAGARKPVPEFFRYALARGGLARDDVVFVANQLNTDVAGAEAFGIRTVWLSGPAHRSTDDTPCNALPTYTIRTLYELPTLLQSFTPDAIVLASGSAAKYEARSC